MDSEGTNLVELTEQDFKNTIILQLGLKENKNIMRSKIFVYKTKWNFWRWKISEKKFLDGFAIRLDTL